jgi:multiple sugar transport system permease protein
VRVVLLFIYAVLFLLAVVMIAPYVWALSNSIKTVPDFYQHPYDLVPRPPTMTTYVNAFTKGQIALYMRNSILYTVAVLAAQMLFNSLAAYAFARVAFPGREALFLGLLATLMLPGSVTLIPSFLFVHYLGLTNTYAGVVVPSFAGAFGIFLLRQFFLNIPREMEDAALIDGAGLFTIYWRIILPLSKPVLITLGVFTFLSEWNSFVWPLIVLSDSKKYPITVGISLFQDMNSTDWPMVFAASTLVSFPVIVLFFFAQKYVIGGISLSGLKG